MSGSVTRCSPRAAPRRGRQFAADRLTHRFGPGSKTSPRLSDCRRAAREEAVRRPRDEPVLGREAEIGLMEASDIPVIGVGEATTSEFPAFQYRILQSPPASRRDRAARASPGACGIHRAHASAP
jgi:hypothetical protein